MPWAGQDRATDVILHLNVACSGGGTPARFEVDKLPDARYRARGNCRTSDLEAVVRQVNAKAACRSFNDVVDRGFVGLPGLLIAWG